jgi:NAD(P)-dependent dehydrogenase (short-subunit alcohol dehydrogenase family)
VAPSGRRGYLSGASKEAQVRTILVAGASRGIGLELVRQYAAAGERVIAGCRHPEGASALGAIAAIAAGAGGRVEVHRLDVTSDTSVAAFKAEVGAEPVDVLLAVAGVSGPDKEGRVGRLDLPGWADTMNTNALGAARVANAFIDNLRAGRGRKLIATTSGLGSTGDSSGGWLAYRASKAALNNIWRNFALALKDDGIVCVAISPGWVRTDMGGPGAELSVEAAVAVLRERIDGLGPEDSGRFLSSKGEDLPW